jgi:hypothetical protein
VWQLANLTPYQAERTWFVDKDGRNHWSVAVKGTFQVSPSGAVSVAEEQEKMLLMPKYWEAAGTSSVRWESDMIGPKGRTDVLVNGSAYAPAGRPAASVDISLRVGNEINKTLRVYGNRWWRLGVVRLRASAPEPFSVMAVKYEAAFGGFDRGAADPLQHRLDGRNPVGTGFFIDSAHAMSQRLPNLEHPATPISGWDDRPAPAGFGAIACDWSPRRELAGTYDEAWLKERFPLWARDFDPRYFQAAPPDQQSQGYLRGGEVLQLTNMTPQGVWRFELPRTYLSFVTKFGRERVNHHANISAVVLEPDRNRVIVSWQTFLSCHHRADELDSTAIREKPYL